MEGEAGPPADPPALQPAPLPPIVPAGSPEATSSGLPPIAAATLACLGGWVTGLLFLAVERESRYVRFHAAQAVVGTGGFWLAGVLCWGGSFPAVFVSAAAFRVLMVAAQVCWAAGVVVWALGLFWAARGERRSLPYLGNLVRRLSGVGSLSEAQPDEEP